MGSYKELEESAKQLQEDMDLAKTCLESKSWEYNYDSLEGLEDE